MTIKPGEWFSYHAITPVSMAKFNWFTAETGCYSLQAMTRMWKDRFSLTKPYEQRRRVMACLDMRMVNLGVEWKHFIEHLANSVFADTYPRFTFPAGGSGGTKGDSWRLEENYESRLNYEREKGAIFFALADAARVLMNRRLFQVKVQDVDGRQWGRLVKWMQAQLGTTKYMAEHDHRRGGPPDPGAPSSEEEPEDEGENEA